MMLEEYLIKPFIKPIQPKPKAHFKVPSQHSLGGSEENHKNPQLGYSLFWPRFESGTSGI
jgi:hypothetical protein